MAPNGPPEPAGMDPMRGYVRKTQLEFLIRPIAPPAPLAHDVSVGSLDDGVLDDVRRTNDLVKARYR